MVDAAQDAPTTMPLATPLNEAKRPNEPKMQNAKQLALHARKASTQKSAAVMASFFKPSTSKLSTAQPGMFPTLSCVCNPGLCAHIVAVGGAENDFDRQFRSFAARKNVTLPPINRFHHPQVTMRNNLEVVVLDVDGDVQMIEPTPTFNLAQPTQPSPFPSDSKGIQC